METRRLGLARLSHHREQRPNRQPCDQAGAPALGEKAGQRNAAEPDIRKQQHPDNRDVDRHNSASAHPEHTRTPA